MRIARPLVIAALAASLVAVGGTAASASTNSPQHFRFGQESFVLTTNSSAQLPTYWATASGVFNGSGWFVTLASPQNGPTYLGAHFFTRGGIGSFFVTAYDNGTNNLYKNKYACSVTETSYGNSYTIKYGTGTLWGLHGWGTYSFFSVQTYPRSWTPWGWTCNFQASPVATYTIIRASGPVFLPWHRYY